MRYRLPLCSALLLLGLAGAAQAQQPKDSTARGRAAQAKTARPATKPPRDAATGMASGRRMMPGAESCMADGKCTMMADVAKEEAAIRDIDEKWLAAVAAKDTAYIRTVHAKDAADLPPNAKIVEGQDAVVASWAGMMSAPGVKLAFEPTSFDFSHMGDLAYETGTYTYEQDNPKGGPRIQDHGKFVVVWRKIDGRWQVVRDIWNSDVAMPGM